MTAAPGAGTLTSKEVVALLGIKPQTLYAYVARGWVRAVAEPGSRTKRYVREDVERLRIRSQAHGGQGAAAAAALHWGAPIITTHITEITPAGPRYRGQPVLALAERGLPFENTAEFLWTGLWRDRPVPWSTAALPPRFLQAAALLGPGPIPRYADRLATLFHLLGEVQGERAELTAGSLLPLARQALLMATGALAYLRPASHLVVAGRRQRLASLAAHALGQPGQAALMQHLNLALTLGADHELPPSTFVARVIASTGGGLYSCLAGAASAFHGVLSGNDPDGLEPLLRKHRNPAAILRQLATRQRQGRAVSGFNHPLYPEGDPRALALFRATQAVAPSADLQCLLAVVAGARDRWGWQPSFHAGLLAVQLAHGLPAGTAIALNLLGRLAGITAHIQEQRLSPVLIRPRAHYLAG